jgi:hypothetical protein
VAADTAPAADPALNTQPSTPPPAREPDRRAERHSPGRPAAGSLADLRTRLDRLPDGHPSSPYDDGGVLKALPHRLKQLELGLPAPERDPADEVHRHDLPAASAGDQASAGRVSPLPPEPAADFAAGHVPDEQPEPRVAGHPAGGMAALADSGPESAGSPGRTADDAMGLAAVADDVAAPADTTAVQSGRTDRGLAGLPDQSAREAQQPRDPLTRPYQIGQPARPPDRPGSNGHGHGQAADYQADRDGRQADGRRASAGHGELVAQLLGQCRAAEGQNLFGGYGESGLTPAIRRIAAQLAHGGLAPGSEADSLKSADRLAAKLARLVARHPDRTAEQLAAGIPDVVRYAFAFESGYYTEGTWLIHRKLKAHGFDLEARRNRWDSPEYKGVWTRWHDPAHDLSFEVQFHTFASWDVMQRTHDAYVSITDPATRPAERASLRARQVQASAAAKAPPHCAEISEFGREAR